MKRSWKLASGSRFTLVFVLLFATAAWVSSVWAAGQPEHLKSGQKVVKAVPAPPTAHSVVVITPGPPVPARQARSAVRVAVPKSAPLPAKPLQVKASAQQAPAGPGNMASALTAKVLPAVSPQVNGPAGAQEASTKGKETPAHISAIVKKTSQFLASAKFTFLPDKALDPFVPFISLQPTNGDMAPANGPLTPLQKMTLAEMQKGLKAIVWGGLGRMAVIQDSTGKGYIVNVGTPAGPNGGVITKIRDNCLVIQQEVWNSRTRKRSPQNFTVKLIKKTDESS